VIERLENQFDRLCDEMIKAIDNQTIDIEGASARLQEIAPNANKDEIKKVL